MKKNENKFEKISTIEIADFTIIFLQYIVVMYLQ